MEDGVASSDQENYRLWGSNTPRKTRIDPSLFKVPISRRSLWFRAQCFPDLAFCLTSSCVFLPCLAFLWVSCLHFVNHAGRAASRTSPRLSSSGEEEEKERKKPVSTPCVSLLRLHDKVPWVGRVSLVNGDLFPHSSRGWNPRSRCQQSSFLLNSCPVDCR
jgi:hypothetical protein